MVSESKGARLEGHLPHGLTAYYYLKEGYIGPPEECAEVKKLIRLLVHCLQLVSPRGSEESRVIAGSN